MSKNRKLIYLSFSSWQKLREIIFNSLLIGINHFYSIIMSFLFAGPKQRERAKSVGLKLKCFPVKQQLAFFYRRLNSSLLKILAALWADCKLFRKFLHQKKYWYTHENLSEKSASFRVFRCSDFNQIKRTIFSEFSMCANTIPYLE